MRILFSLILSACALPAAAQRHFIGATGGVSWTNVSAKNFIDNNSDRQGFSAGLTYAYQTRRHLTFGADLKYDQRGFINYIIFTDANARPTGRKEPTRFNYSYLSAPLKAGFSIGKRIYSIANVGLVPALLLNAHHQAPVFDHNANVVGQATYKLTMNVTKFDLAGLAEIGLGYQFKNACAVFSTVSYQQSFTTITSGSYFSQSSIRHYGTSVSVGITCPLRRRGVKLPAKADVESRAGHVISLPSPPDRLPPMRLPPSQ